MARIKYDIDEDSTLIKYLAVQYGEIFMCDGAVYIKAQMEGKAVSLDDGTLIPFDDDELVTYVKKAELKLTI